MSKIQWKTDVFETVGIHQVPRVADLVDGYNQGSGVKRSSRTKMLLKRVLWPLLKFRNDLIVDGFIEWEIGRLIRKYLTSTSVFLEIGCGDMSLRKYVPKDLWYNALDLEISDLHIVRVLKNGRNVNVVLASATEIPAPDNSVSLIVSTETFEHIPEIDKAINEMYRVATPDATLICSIPNNYCFKYKKKGPHPGHVNNWAYQEFIEYMRLHDFQFIEGFMKGIWIPFPLWLVKKNSFELPVASKSEYYNTHFFYVFKARK